MKPAIVAPCGLISVLTILSMLCGQADAAQSLLPGWVCGTVVGPNGKVVAGASVSLDDFDDEAEGYKPVARTVTGSDGTFRLGPLVPVFRDAWELSNKDLRIEAAGFAPQAVPRGAFSIFPGVDTALGTIRLDRGQVLNGQVLDCDGRPRAGAAVECQARRYFTAAFASPLTPTYRLKTDAEGRFVTPPLPVSFAGFTVRVPGRQMPWVRVAVGPEGRAEVPPIRLRPASALMGILTDNRGTPIIGAKIYAMGWDFGPAWLLHEQLASDSQGRFVLDGLGQRIQLQISAVGHVGIEWVLRCGPDGVRCHEVRGWDGDVRKLSGPTDVLRIALRSVAWIEGRAIDADTGQPVHLDRIVRCNFDRKANGEIVLNGCQSPEFSQGADGVFRLPYSFPDEYHLTLSAAGYQEAEALTPLVKRLQPVSGIVVRMHKLKDAAARPPARQTISGTVTRDGRPVRSGWVALCYPLTHQANKLNVGTARGRTVTGHGNLDTSAPIRDGKYSLDVPYQRDDWVIEEEEPGEPITQLTHVAVALNEKKILDIAAVHGGSVSGQVAGIRAPWLNDTFVVAFTRGGLIFETPVAPDGRFAFHQLPPGEYGLKAGHDAFLDAERPPEVVPDADQEYSAPAEPWKRATIVHVEADRRTTRVQLRFPED